jgi:hypothetical protein
MDGVDLAFIMITAVYATTSDHGDVTGTSFESSCSPTTETERTTPTFFA